MKAPLIVLGGAAALVLLITAAIVAVAPYLAGATVLAGLFAYLSGEEEDNEDKNKPP